MADDVLGITYRKVALRCAEIAERSISPVKATESERYAVFSQGWDEGCKDAAEMIKGYANTLDDTPSFRRLLTNSILYTIKEERDGGRYGSFHDGVYIRLNKLDYSFYSSKTREAKKHRQEIRKYRVSREDLDSFSDLEFLDIVGLFYFRKWVMR